MDIAPVTGLCQGRINGDLGPKFDLVVAAPLFKMALAKNSVFITAGGALKIGHVLYKTEHGNVHHVCHFNSFSTIIPTKSWGELTTIIPSTGKD